MPAAENAIDWPLAADRAVLRNHYKHRLARLRKPLYSDNEMMIIWLPNFVLFSTYLFLLIPDITLGDLFLK